MSLPPTNAKDIGIRQTAMERATQLGAELRVLIRELYLGGMTVRRQIHLRIGCHRNVVYEATKGLSPSDVSPLPEKEMDALLARAVEVGAQWKTAREQWSTAIPGVKETILQMYEGGETNLTEISRRTSTNWTTVQKTLVNAKLLQSAAAAAEYDKGGL